MDGRVVGVGLRRMPIVEFDREKTVEVDEPDLTLLVIAREAGIPHAAACGGNGRCSTCRPRKPRRSHRRWTG